MHTKEPWILRGQAYRNGQTGRHGTHFWIVCPDGETTLPMDTSGSPEADWNGKRIVACVNALAGIADPAAFVAKVRELIAAARVLEGAELDMGLIRDDTGDIEELNAEATNVCEVARDLAALLPAE